MKITFRSVKQELDKVRHLMFTVGETVSHDRANQILENFGVDSMDDLDIREYCVVVKMCNEVLTKHNGK